MEKKILINDDGYGGTVDSNDGGSDINSVLSKSMERKTLMKKMECEYCNEMIKQKRYSIIYT